MENVIGYTIMRAVIVYVLALILARMMGRKLISQMTFFDFVVGVSMGSLVANAMVDPSNSSSTSVISLIAISILTIAVAFINTKSFNFRKLTDSEPITIVENGKIVEENMKNTRMTVSELMMKMREKNAFSLADVEFAIMETDGQLSVLPKADKKPLTPAQMNIKTTSEGLMKDVIIDGNIMNENLKSTGMDENWLNSELKKQGIQNISDVFYAGVYANKKLHVSRKSNNENEKHGQYGME
ncbi:YetF domain-containing protein [Clostridium beijerinckii]|uniref:YetF domain-containing protein n=1 Tax=Clostridium beijerinckii TaxID=1520 RepID=UPI00098CB97D|nr:DUF421 domain-containing protein [Clostridium beijerinckii]MBA8934562.1 uncharacterized membrane protein YcaP (DUF421 family) [Clostridium beijerinckii]NRT35540.1 uncharacterized membrane protein YcaP (DUF421 family) [Clostridium beijerinckii]NRT45032.1 uncharacterized membrane protein YcaP (DUF421 family) [Clostridium beijerinckii]NRU38748.1 uncharacterized membrane protein YcaP (DUF421 family) [Clostridium beijerinckii]NRZ20972.1 uncharacterized membrane protein YcaP (DUF421 family) [Clos